MSEEKTAKKNTNTLKKFLPHIIHVNLHKRLHGMKFKKRAPGAIKEIKKLVSKQLGAKIVFIDPIVNTAIWKGGIRSPPSRIIVRATVRNLQTIRSGQTGLYAVVDLPLLSELGKTKTPRVVAPQAEK